MAPPPRPEGRSRPETTDAEIIGASLGDPPRFATIFDRHVGSIHRFLERRLGPDGADSLTGESFRIAFEGRASYRLDRSDALPWLYGIANNVLRQHRRGELRRMTAQRRIEGSVAVDAPPHEGPAASMDAETAGPRSRRRWRPCGPRSATSSSWWRGRT